MKFFHGLIKELPNVSVDNFANENVSSTCFFLSHCHQDHMNGLHAKSKFINKMMENQNYFLYCSPITRSILLNMMPDILTIRNQIIEVTGSLLIKVPGNNETDTVSYRISVTLIPAGHCPGSVMFLFEQVGEKVILYTGDFRIVKGDTNVFMQLQKFTTGHRSIDKILLDTTFIHENYSEFPKLSHVFHAIISLVRNFLVENPNFFICLFSYTSFGYEALLVKLAKAFQSKIFVKERYFNWFKNVPEIAEILTQDKSKSKISYNAGTVDDTSLKIQLKAWAFEFSKSPEYHEIIREVAKNRFDVCYPTHCSRSEIIDFLRYLRPKSVESTCSSYKCDETQVEKYLEDILNDLL